MTQADNKKPTVYTILPVHNRIKLTKKCLKSFQKQTYKNFQVIIVDDGSTDGTSKYLEKNYPEWKVIKGSGNWWWTKSIHKGIKEALKTAKERDFILTMNNDCFFDKNYLKSIVEASIKNKRAIVGSVIIDAKDKDRVVDSGVKINWEKGLIYGIADKIASNLDFYKSRGIIDKVDTLPGKGTLIPVSVIKKVGNFNYKLLPHYLADYEFFLRAKQNGVPLAVSANAELYNYTGLTGKYKKQKTKASLKEIFYLLFGRKSKNNIVDYTVFVLLRCPKKHLPKNLFIILARLSAHFPFISKVRLVIHNIPIYTKQSYERLDKHFKDRQAK